ncbi:hypothetical protein [Algoriphagus aquimarinus]|uniref:hypothetical protein n=1 Tax=Algoriphagus aquimarinus TaxID=237018 RepID=UPI0030DCDDB6
MQSFTNLYSQSSSLNEEIKFLALKWLSAVAEAKYMVIRSTVRGDRNGGKGNV